MVIVSNMTSPDVCPMEDAIQAFLEHLIDPLLPAKSSVRDKPTPSQQESLAKQVRAVVLLYNYYHRKHHPELVYLPFNEFCKLVVVMRPSLLAYMQFMQKINEAELTDVEKQLSLPEKEIMNACDICKRLDPSKNAPNIDGWPISKVAVLLLDSEKENCLLVFGSITRGIWSLVEKDLDTSNHSSEVTSATKSTYKNKRVIRKPTKDELNLVETQLLEAGYFAVKEAIGINKTDITLLERHTVYSHSKEKAASRFYIMQCTLPIGQEVVQVPLKDVIKSLQGPLIKKDSGCWSITPVVDYFHMLPYSEIILEWNSRKAFSNSLQDSRVTEKNIKGDSSVVTESSASEDMSTGLDSKPERYNIAPKQKKDNESITLRQSNHIKEPCDMDLDESSIFPSENKDICNDIVNTVQLGEDQEKKKPSVHYKSNARTSEVKAMKVDSTTTKDEINNYGSYSSIFGKGHNTSYEKEKNTVDEHTPVPKHSKLDLKKLIDLLDSKGKILSQTALTALIRKRNELALRHRPIEDEIAMCEHKIQKILTEGEDDVVLKIESIIEGCNDLWARNEESAKLQNLSPCIKRKKFTEDAAVTKGPCEELDAICRANNWVVPTYRVSAIEGGFQAVCVKGVDFQFTCSSELCLSPREARDCAAARMIVKIKSMAESIK
ncbi:hypothetical protein HN51_010182 [Arachis hypogaea]|uniref:DRBM domain-containing protein n=2 Tax=Arachis TaxID=3817 RepID=A0A445E3Y0_ARAHY|nr:uncharacterized protein LOC107476773 isoform X1 [Arachis duranensis]XP_025686306.1 uncharacterized protein LOC112788869 [Arachis hypogaea]QHO55247.1 uncharacterized protein DS421_3g63670 [Arachis hypogaea]RYR70148.1 hypothetical protein Ahy_A03g016661 [Arachis hypogaea]